VYCDLIISQTGATGEELGEDFQHEVEKCIGKIKLLEDQLRELNNKV
jgi:hypothetical protein